MENKAMKSESGITLIALAVTIIVLIILALITIDATIGENGLFKKAQEMQDYLKNAQTADEEAINEVLEEMEGSTSSNNAGGEETNKEITVEVQASPTSSTITINASGSNAQGKIENGTYRYYIRKVEVGSEFSEKNGTGETCIIEELEQDTEYEIKVECEDGEGNIGSKTIKVKTLKVTDADVEEGAITFENLTWRNKQASITIKTNTDYIIEYQVNSTSGEWIRGSKISTIASGLHHGDIVNARLTDGINAGNYTTYNVIDEIEPRITITKGAVTSNSITITVKGEDEESGMEESARYRYYIKKQGEGDTSYKEKTGTGNSCTITGLEQETGYTVKVEVEDIAGNTGKGEENITTDKVTGGTEQGAITFDSLSWSNRQASVVIRTNTSYKIEYQVNGTNVNNWTEGNTVATTVNGLHHGDIVYARLTDGINSGGYTSYNVIDSIAPTINSFTVENVTENSITVSVEAVDNQSGLAQSGTYAYYKNGSLVETSESNTCIYTGLTGGIEYELKVIVKDQAGKTAERITSGTTKEPLPTVEEKLKEGDYVLYEDKSGYSHNCIVLYGPENTNYYSYGIQIITQDLVEDVDLGKENNFTTSKTEYNTAISILNNKARNYLNTMYATDARCIGSEPDNPDYDGASYDDQTGLKTSDNNYLTDYNKIEELGVNNINSPYWLASRYLQKRGPAGGKPDISAGVRIIDDGSEDYYLICFVEENGEGSSKGYTQTAGLRPIFRLKDGIKIIDGSGKSYDPYILGN